MTIPRIDLIGLNGNDGLHYKRECDGCDTPAECIDLNCIHYRGSSNERDPTGLDPHDPGAKLDTGKIRAGLVIGGFARALQRVSQVGTFGANKYSADGWKSVDGGFQRYTDAMLRHYLDESSGERVDKDSGCLHAAQVAWNALARLEFLLQEIDDEDRSDRQPDYTVAASDGLADRHLKPGGLPI
jgi:hypothetical protein